jgi:hypothetical protein
MRVPVQRDSTATGVVGAKVALIKPGSNVTFTEAVVGDKLEVTIAASGGGGGGGTPASSVVSETSFGLSPVVGTSTDYARGDHSHGSPTIPLASSVVAETSFGQSSAVGTSTSVARADHTHGTPTIPLASSVVTETAFGQASAIGTSTSVARADHTHGTPAVPAHSALSSLAWTSSGHTGTATSVATFDGSGAAAVSTPSADGQVLSRQGGALVWVTLAAGLALYSSIDDVLEEDMDVLAVAMTYNPQSGTIS